MTTARYTIVGSLPPRKLRASASERYRDIIEAAIEHEGEWVRLEEFSTTEPNEAAGQVSNLRNAAETAQRHFLLRAGFQVAYREGDDGLYRLYLRKRTVEETL